MLLLFLDRSDHHYHPLALELRHVLSPSVLLELDGEAEKKFLSLVGELDRTAPEEYRCLHLGTLSEELLGMLELELKVVLVSVRAEADLLDDYLGGILLHLLGLLLLLVEILLIVKYLAHRRVCLGGNLDQVKLHLVSHLHCCRNGIDARFRNVVTDETHLRCPDLVIDVQFILVLAVA